MTLHTWKGEKNRQLDFRLPCPCRCDERDGDSRPYLTTSDADGNGVTIRLDPADVDRLAKRFAGALRVDALLELAAKVGPR